MNEDEIYTAYREAIGPEREELESTLIRLLQAHAHAVVYLTLGEKRPDIVNYAVWKALDKHETFKARNNAKFSTWFHTIVANLCRSALRTKRAQREQSLDDMTPEREGMFATAPDVEDRLEFEQVLAQMTPQDRQMVQMKVMGATANEIAEALGIAPETVPVRFFRLKQKLREEKDVEPEDVATK